MKARTGTRPCRTFCLPTERSHSRQQDSRRSNCYTADQCGGHWTSCGRPGSRASAVTRAWSLTPWRFARSWRSQQSWSSRTQRRQNLNRSGGTIKPHEHESSSQVTKSSSYSRLQRASSWPSGKGPTPSSAEWGVWTTRSTWAIDASTTASTT